MQGSHRNTATEAPPNDRLESWKEIATFLGKGIRTVQRWEVTEGLPVRRHVHERGSTVYAYKSELRAWSAVREPALAEQPKHEGIANPGRRGLSRMRSYLSASLLLALLFLAVIHMWPDAGSVTGKLLTPAPLVSHAGRASQTVLSPDGDRIVYCWNGERGGDSHLDLYELTIGRGAPRRLTSYPSNDHSPAWSPDGRHLAWLRNDVGVILKPVEGESERILMDAAPDSGFGVGMSWSPDGKWLVFSQRASPGTPLSLLGLSVADGQTARLTTPRADSVGDMYPAHSPDGRHLAFVREVRGPATDIHLVKVADDGRTASAPVRLTFDNRVVFGLTWLHNGRELVFSSDRLGARRLWIVKVSPSGRRPPVAEPLPFGEDAYQPTVSRQGDRLVYSRRYWNSGVWRAEVPGRSRLPGPPVNVIASAKENWDAQYSPDGGRIAFVSTRTGTTEIWVSDSSGSDAVQLTSFGRAGTLGPRWSPDGRTLVFYSGFDGHASVYTVRIAQGTPRQLTRDGSHCFAPSWSSDGKWIYYTSNRTGENQVWRMTAEGESHVRLTHSGGEHPLESPDGSWLYYLNQGIWRMPVRGGSESRVTEPPVGSMAAAGQFLFYDRGFGDFVRSTAHALDLSTGKAQTVVRFERPKLAGLSVSPDAGYILYSLREREGSDLMLVEKLR